MKCQSCQKPKASLSSVNSKIFPALVNLMCKTCIDGGFEPRGLIVMGARQGVDVRRYIVDKKYVGEELSAIEVTP